jgi:hypothetical protein
MKTAKPDYAKWSLLLGGGSVIIGLGYWYWQYRNAETSSKWHEKYEEAKRGIQDFQRFYGLYPSGKIDAQTQDLLKKLAAS